MQPGVPNSGADHTPLSSREPWPPAPLLPMFLYCGHAPPSSACSILFATDPTWPQSQKLAVEDDEVKDWWDCTRSHVHSCFKKHRNNTIKGIKKLFQGKTAWLKLWARWQSFANTNRHTERMVPQGTKDTGEDEAHLLEAEFKGTHVRMRSINTAANYIHMLDQLIQAVLTYKVYKMNRTTRPFSDWVTVSDEAFLIIVLKIIRECGGMKSNFNRWAHLQRVKMLRATRYQRRGTRENRREPSGAGQKGDWRLSTKPSWGYIKIGPHSTERNLMLCSCSIWRTWCMKFHVSRRTTIHMELCYPGQRTASFSATSIWEHT